MQDLKFSRKLPTIKQIKNLLVREALKRSNGNQTDAANKLGISKTALEGHLQKIQTARQVLVLLFFLLSAAVDGDSYGYLQLVCSYIK